MDPCMLTFRAPVTRNRLATSRALHVSCNSSSSFHCWDNDQPICLNRVEKVVFNRPFLHYCRSMSFTTYESIPANIMSRLFWMNEKECKPNLQKSQAVQENLSLFGRFKTVAAVAMMCDAPLNDNDVDDRWNDESDCLANLLVVAADDVGRSHTPQKLAIVIFQQLHHHIPLQDWSSMDFWSERIILRRHPHSVVVTYDEKCHYGTEWHRRYSGFLQLCFVLSTMLDSGSLQSQFLLSSLWVLWCSYTWPARERTYHQQHQCRPNILPSRLWYWLLWREMLCIGLESRSLHFVRRFLWERGTPPGAVQTASLAGRLPHTMDFCCNALPFGDDGIIGIGVDIGGQEHRDQQQYQLLPSRPFSRRRSPPAVATGIQTRPRWCGEWHKQRRVIRSHYWNLSLSFLFGIYHPFFSHLTAIVESGADYCTKECILKFYRVPLGCRIQVDCNIFRTETGVVRHVRGIPWIGVVGLSSFVLLVSVLLWTSVAYEHVSPFLHSIASPTQPSACGQ